MATEKTIHNARLALPHLVQYAKMRKTITYGELGDKIDRHVRAMRWLLAYIRDEICVPRDLPFITAIVVNKATQMPGGGWLPEGTDHLTAEENKRKYEEVRDEVFRCDSWDGLLAELELWPVQAAEDELDDEGLAYTVYSQRSGQVGEGDPHRSLKEYVKGIQPEIVHCYNCQPFEEGEVVWVLGERHWLEELFDEHEVPESIRDELAENLDCSFCGTRMQRFDDVGLMSQAEKEFDRRLEGSMELYAQPLSEFAAFLESYPYLGLQHPLGRQIILAMDDFPKTDISGSQWFRARRITGGTKLGIDDLRPPDPAKVPISEGRYNHFGQAHWYLADSEVGAADEALQKGETLAWMQRVYMHEGSSILEVSRWWLTEHTGLPLIAMALVFSRVLERPVDRTTGWKPEYFVPRFVGDAAKVAGFKGVLFTSARHYHRNLVLFDPDSVRYDFRGEPYVFELPAVPNRPDRVQVDFGLLDFET